MSLIQNLDLRKHEDIAWAKLPYNIQCRAVRILREHLSDEYLADIRNMGIEKGVGNWLPLFWHHSDGMAIRNLLREHGIRDAELPGLPEVYDGEDYGGNWDDYYVQCLEAAVGLRTLSE